MMGLPQAVKSSSVIGTGILGLVTTAMYDNPLAIYREYIQNSTDAIAGRVAATEGKVEITIDPSERRVKIWDNGPGLSNEDAPQQLVPIGRSNKQIGNDRGFRGIGRLAGLAFAETVTFTTRARRDELVTRITWNSSRLPSGTASVGEIEEVVRDCVDVESLPDSGYPDHFFEVEMRGIARHAAGSLLNREAVRRYVSEVCPVPMAAAFPYSLRVEDLYRPNVPLMSVDITLDGDLEPVRRPHGETIQLSANREDRFTEFEEVHIPSVDRIREAAVGWIAHSSYLGAIPKGTQIRGIRARAGNIQIGDETIFDSLYSEERFNRWCVGELHILDHRIVPNARRDYFESGPHLRNLENHLLPILRGVGERCRAASAARNRTRKVLSSLCGIEEAHDLATSGYLTDDDATALVRRALLQIPSLRKGILSLKLGTESIDRLDMVETSLENFRNGVKPSHFSHMSPSDVAVYQRMFHLLATASPSPRTAKDLISAILAQTSSPGTSGVGGAQ